MKRFVMLGLVMMAAAGVCRAQGLGGAGGAGGAGSYAAGGNSNYGRFNGRTRAYQQAEGSPPTSTSMFIEARVLMNVKADHYVAVFGLLQEGSTPLECNQKMDGQVQEVTRSWKAMGIRDDDIYLDFIVQNKIYGYKLEDNIAREVLVGFELKKNISIHFTDASLLDKLVAAAARSNIFDLIKEDYVVKDTGAIRSRMLEEAARIIRQKAADYDRLLGAKVQLPEVYTDSENVYFPTDMYRSYTASESERIDEAFFEHYTIQHARKNATFFFNGLNGDGFDSVINPIILEPVVQFTLDLKMKYEVEQPDNHRHKRRAR